MKQVLQIPAELVICGMGMSAAGEVVPTVVEGATYQFRQHLCGRACC